jgi:hypothetical protein
LRAVAIGTIYHIITITLHRINATHRSLLSYISFLFETMTSTTANCTGTLIDSFTVDWTEYSGAGVIYATTTTKTGDFNENTIASVSACSSVYEFILCENLSERSAGCGEAGDQILDISGVLGGLEVEVDPGLCDVSVSIGDIDTCEATISEATISEDASSEGASSEGASSEGASSGGASSGDESVGDASVGDASSGDASGGDASGGDASGGDASGGDASGGDASGGDASGGDASSISWSSFGSTPEYHSKNIDKSMGFVVGSVALIGLAAYAFKRRNRATSKTGAKEKLYQGGELA